MSNVNYAQMMAPIAVEEGPNTLSDLLTSRPGGIVRVAIGWQPIETAPKDGTDILLYEDFEPDVCRGSFLGGEWCRNSCKPFWREPTHWMPIKPPAIVLR